MFNLLLVKNTLYTHTAACTKPNSRPHLSRGLMMAIRNLSTSLLCHGAFPQCTGGMSKQLCANHCRLCQTLEDLCPEVYRFLPFLVLVTNPVSYYKQKVQKKWFRCLHYPQIWKARHCPAVFMHLLHA